MIREFAGALAPGRAPEAARLRAALDDPDGQLAEAGPLALAYRGPPVAQRAPLCIIDGRVHNAEALRAEFGLGPDSAVERVIAAGYERLGEAVLERLRGEFALVIWDESRAAGILARDPLGLRPLFVRPAAESLLFASEIRLLLRVLRARPRPDGVAVAQFLADGLVSDTRTVYDGIFRLPAGHVMALGERSGAPRPYWAFGREGQLDLTLREAGEELRPMLARAVGRQVGSDRQVAVQLSGGLDSSAVAAVAVHGDTLGERELRAYSEVFPEPRHAGADESEHLAVAAQTLGLAPTRVVLRRPAVLPAALRYMADWEVPLAAAGHFSKEPLFSRAAADGVGVMLDGWGGDEVFGASPYLLSDLVSRGRLLGALRQTRRLPGYALAPTARNAARILIDYGVRGALPHRLHRAALAARPGSARRHAPEWFSPATRRAYLGATDLWAWKRREASHWRAHYGSLMTDLVDDLDAYHYLRRVGASSGVRVAHPLRDLDVVDFVFRLPPQLAWDPVLTRPVLREAVRGVLDDRLRLRPGKSPFNPLLVDALTGSDAGAVRTLLDDPSARVNAYVDPVAVRDQLFSRPPQAYRGGRGAWCLAVWRLTAIECWLRGSEDTSFYSSAAAMLGASEAGFSIQSASDLFAT